MTITTIQLPAEQPITVDLRGRALTEEAARQLTAEIQRTSARLWVLVTEAHDRKAHAALGYDTWEQYVRAELKMSPSRSYQLLDTGHVMRELAAAGADLEAIPVPTTRVVAKVKDRLPEVRRVIRRAVSSGEDVDRALRSMASAPRTTDPEDVVVVTAKRPGRQPTMVQCPVCHGEGKVSKSLSAKALAWLRREEKKTAA